MAFYCKLGTVINHSFTKKFLVAAVLLPVLLPQVQADDAATPVKGDIAVV